MRFQKPALASNTSLAGRQIKNTSQRDAFWFEISAFVSVIKIQAIFKFDRRWDHRAPDGLSSIQLSWYCSNGRGFMLPSWFLSDSLRDIHRAWTDLTGEASISSDSATRPAFPLFCQRKNTLSGGGLSRGKGNAPMERSGARKVVGLAGNDRMLTLSIENIIDDKAYISTNNV